MTTTPAIRKISLRPTIARIIPWLTLWAEAAAEIWQAQDETVVCEVTVPGVLGEDGAANNKGNVVLAIPTDETADFIEELKLQAEQGRPLTAAEMVRKSAEWINLGTEEAPDYCLTFKASAASGSRTVKVRQADVPVFIESLSARLQALQVRWEEAVEEAAAMAAKS